MGLIRALRSGVNGALRTIGEVDPLAREGIRGVARSSTRAVRDGSGFVADIGRELGWSDLEKFGLHWQDMARKDSEDTGRLITNAALTAAALYGGYSALGAGGAAGGAAGGSAAGGGAAGAAGTAGAAGAAGSVGGAGAGAGAAGAAGGSAMGWGDWASLAANLGSSLMQANAASDAADAQSEATRSAVGEQRRQFDLQRSDTAIARALGDASLLQLASENGRQPTAQEVMATPGYQFGMDQGLQALDRRFAASGGRVSGASMKAATRYGTDYAASGYNSAYQRTQDRLNRLAAIAGIGQTATNASSAAGQNSTNAISSLLSSQGDATAASRLAQGNIWGNALNSAVSGYQRRVGNSNTMQPDYGDSSVYGNNSMRQLGLG